MLTLRARPHDRVHVAEDELGLSLDDLGELPWVAERVASVRRTRVGMEIIVGPFVGQLVVPDRLILDVVEPFPGTLSACLGITTGGRRAGDQEADRGAINVRPWAPVITRFADELVAYVRGGAEKRYINHGLATTKPRGRLDITRTATRLWPRGRTDLLACQVRLLTEDTNLNRVLLSAAVKAEAIARQIGTRGPLPSLRVASMALSGARLVAAPNVRAARAEISRSLEEAVSLLGLAETILHGVPALPPPRLEDATFPMSAWLNAERIFEDAVRSVVSDAAPPGTVRSGKSDGVTLLTDIPGDPGGRLAAADPDVVVDATEQVLLLDAKYRRHGDAYADDELYQLMAHSRAYRATAAALVAPGVARTEGIYAIGTDSADTAYYLIAVDPSSEESLRQHVSRWVAERLTPT